MSNNEHWYDERYSHDAPIWYSQHEATAWANGYNAAVQEFNKEFLRNLKREMGINDPV